MSSQGNIGLSVTDAVEQIGFGRFQVILIAVSGALHAVDAMEMNMLSFLGRSVQCQWHLSSHQIAWIATCVFVGSTIGAPVLGFISDRYGRKNGLILSSCIIAYYGAISAGSPTLPWILILRGFVGFAVGGLLPLSAAMVTEFIPIRWRARSVMLTIAFWTVGGLFEVLIAWLFLGSDGVFVTDGWRRMLAITSIPLFLVLAPFLWVPKSPRFLLASGHHDEALVQLNRMARINKRPELTGPITDPAAKAARGDFRSLFANSTVTRLTLLLLIVWFCCLHVYYGTVMLSTELPGLPHNCLQNWSQVSEASAGKSSHDCCKTFGSSDFKTAAIATLGEFLAYIEIALLVDIVGRRALMAGNTAVVSILLVCMQFCMSPTVLAVLLFFTRAASQAVCVLIYIYTSEAYPTTIRTLGMGVCCAMSRIGALLSPFVAQVLLSDYSVLAGLLTYAGLSLVATVAVLLLPFDTKDRPLTQTVEETMVGTPRSSSPAERDGLRLTGDPKSYSSLDGGDATADGGSD